MAADFIDQLPNLAAPLRATARALLGADTRESAQAVELGHTPEAGPEAYAVTLFKPLSESSVASYAQFHGMDIAPAYRGLLAHLNGCHAYRLSLFGLPASMASNPPLLSRGSAQPFDLATANRAWRIRYSAPKDWLHIGSAPLSDDENVGYFQDPDNAIHALRKGGASLDSWPSISSFLAAELERCQAAYPSYVRAMSATLASRPSALRRLWSKVRGRANEP